MDAGMGRGRLLPRLFYIMIGFFAKYFFVLKRHVLLHSPMSYCTCPCIPSWFFAQVYTAYYRSTSKIEKLEMTENKAFCFLQLHFHSHLSPLSNGTSSAHVGILLIREKKALAFAMGNGFDLSFFISKRYFSPFLSASCILSVKLAIVALFLSQLRNNC